jgi:hypothetical protein
MTSYTIPTTDIARIQEAAAEYRELLATLRETDHSVVYPAQQICYLDQLSKDFKAVQKQLIQLDTRKDQHLRGHEKYQRSVVKRFAYQFGGRGQEFTETATRKEQKYFTARLSFDSRCRVVANEESGNIGPAQGQHHIQKS